LFEVGFVKVENFDGVARSFSAFFIGIGNAMGKAFTARMRCNN
jgi:hypothetical protein